MFLIHVTIYIDHHCGHIIFLSEDTLKLLNFSQDVLVDNNLILFEHLKLTEKFSLGWESNHMPLTFQVSTLPTRPLRQLLSHCPLSKGPYI